jgi:hypothetical protein
MINPPYGMEKEITQVRTSEFITQPYHPYNTPTTAVPYPNNILYGKPICFREKRPCLTCQWKHECGNVEKEG